MLTMGVSRQGRIRRLSSEQVADGGYGMGLEHARARIAHDRTDAFAFFGLIAVVLAFIARRFHVHLAAAACSEHSVVIDDLAFRTDALAAKCGFLAAAIRMIFGAVQGYHLRNGALFAGAPAFYFGCIFHKAKDSTARAEEKIDKRNAGNPLKTALRRRSEATWAAVSRRASEADRRSGPAA